MYFNVTNIIENVITWIPLQLHVLLQIHSRNLLLKHILAQMYPLNCVKTVHLASSINDFPVLMRAMKHSTWPQQECTTFVECRCFSLSLFMWFTAVKEAKQQGPDRRLDMTMKLKSCRNCSPCWPGTEGSESTARQQEKGMWPLSLSI